MALDGIAIFNIVKELEDKLVGNRINKVYQPEKDEVIFLIRGKEGNSRLLLTASSSYPRVHFTEIVKDNPMTAPLFCMTLRKHLTGGKVTKITQPIFDRIVNIHVEGYNELGDLTEKIVVIEIMGKRSNIILINNENIVLESIKHISFEKSSVRPIFPGRKYNLPPNSDKLNPLFLDKEVFLENLKNRVGDKLQSFFYRTYNGFSPIMADEICFRCGYDENTLIDESLNVDLVFDNFVKLMKSVEQNEFSNFAVYDEYNKLIDFTVINMEIYNDNKKTEHDSLSELLEFYYKEKDLVHRINQKSTDLKKLVENNISRCKKKSKIYDKTLKDIEDRNRLKLYGELLTANIYSIPKGVSEFTCQNYYEEELPEVTIKINPNLTPIENAQKYFKKYNKAKRTFVALQSQINENIIELEYLETVLNSLSASIDESDINEIREELYSEGYLKKKKNKKANNSKEKSKPLHFVSEDGFDIYVGKNNNQNDFLTMKFADSNDIWLHTKDMPGSHVIIKTNNKEVSEKALLIGANLAGFYSKGKTSSNVPIDYTEKRNVRKPSGAKPGFVIYEKNKTIYVTPDENLIRDL